MSSYFVATLSLLLASLGEPQTHNKNKSGSGALTNCKTVEPNVQAEIKKGFDLHLCYHFKLKSFWCS